MTRAIHKPHKLDVAMGRQIRGRRIALSMSQTALADAVGVTFQQIQKYERGSNRVSFSRLVEIAHTLDCRVMDLIGDLDDLGLPSPLFARDTAHLREAGAPELMAAYVQLPPAMRKVVLQLVIEIGKVGHVTERPLNASSEDTGST